MLRCAILDDYQDSALRRAGWKELKGRVEFKVFREHIAEEGQLGIALADFDVVVLMRERTRFTRSLLRTLPKLKLLVTTGSRNGSVDVAACQEQGVTFCGTRNGNAAAGELTWGLILAQSRHLLAEAGSLRRGGPWQQTEGLLLAGRTLGVIGLGLLGGGVARVGLAFGMHVTAWSAHLQPSRCQEVGVQQCETLEELLSTSDIVTIHQVLSDRTRGLIGARELAQMRQGALLVNTSRSAIVDEPALIEALRSGVIAGAALDVFDQEPLPVDHPFRTLPNMLATPHIGFVTEQSYDIFYGDAAENIAAWLRGEPVRQILDQHPAQAGS